MESFSSRLFPVRQLLGGDGGGGSSSSSANKNKNKKEKDKPKEDKPGTREAMEIHCCVGDGCNGAPHMISLPSTFLLFSFLLCTLFASLHLQPPYLRTVWAITTVMKFDGGSQDEELEMTW